MNATNRERAVRIVRNISLACTSESVIIHMENLITAELDAKDAEIERLRARLAAAEKVLEEIATPDTGAPFYILIDGKRVLVDEHAAVQWRMDKARDALNPPA